MKDDHELESYQHPREEPDDSTGWTLWAVAAAVVLAGLAKLAGF